MSMETTPLRIRFCKMGDMRFISHLDLVRSMARAFARAGLPQTYSKGFNPHPVMMFNMPLSLGFESCCEVLDTALDALIAPDQAQKLLSAVLPDGLDILRVGAPIDRLKDIAYARYTVTLDFDCADNELADDVSMLWARDELVMMKKSKRGERPVDILPLIKNIDVRQCDGGLSMGAVLCLRDEAALNPELLTRAVARHVRAPVSARYMREGFYKADMTPFE